MNLKEMRAIAAKMTAGEWKLEMPFTGDTYTGGWQANPGGICGDCSMDTTDAKFVSLAAGVFDQLLSVAEAAQETLGHYVRIAEGGPIVPANDIGKLSAALAALEANNA